MSRGALIFVDGLVDGLMKLRFWGGKSGKKARIQRTETFLFLCVNVGLYIDILSESCI